MAPASGPGTGAAATTPAGLVAVLDALPTRVEVWGRDRRLLHANATALDRLGVSRRAALGRLLQELVPAEELLNEEPFLSAVMDGAPQHHDRLVRGPDGRSCFEEVWLLPWRAGERAGEQAGDEHGEVAGVVLVAVDATERVHAQRATRVDGGAVALLADRQRLAADLDTAVLAGLDLAVEDLGRADREPTEGRDPLVTSAARRVDLVITSLRSTVAHLRNGEHPAPTGTTPPMPTTQPAPGADGDPGPSDLTEDDLAEVLDLLPLEVTVVDAAFLATWANLPALRSYALADRADVVGRDATTLLGRAATRALVSAGPPLPDREVRLQRARVTADGRTRHDLVSYGPWAAGGVVEVRDLTPEVETQEQRRAVAARIAVLEDRVHDAEDLHDLVIQHLYGAVLVLTGPRGGTPDGVAQAVRSIEAGREALRLAIHGLNGAEAGFDLARTVDLVVGGAADELGFAPVLRWGGRPAEAPFELCADVVAVLEEALANVARHAAATRVYVDVTADADGVRLRVEDDGRGPGGTGPGSGLANLQTRAVRRGGGLTCEPGRDGGTVLRWWTADPASGSAPVPDGSGPAARPEQQPERRRHVRVVEVETDEVAAPGQP